MKPNIGFTIEEGYAAEGRKDAVHSPIILVSSTELLQPGTRLRFIDDHLCAVTSILKDKSPHAIVDPFLTEPVAPGRLFWAFLFPRITANLTHQFEIIDHIEEELHDNWCRQSCNP